MQSCEANYVFDPELKRCVPYEEATCSNGTGVRFKKKSSIHQICRCKWIYFYSIQGMVQQPLQPLQPSIPLQPQVQQLLGHQPKLKLLRSTLKALLPVHRKMAFFLFLVIAEVITTCVSEELQP